MIGVFLADIASILTSWQDIGVFAYVLPFLLIFALVFGILSQAKFLGENKGVNSIIALAIALLALQFGKVPAFFAQIMPNLGVGLAVLLAALILMGLFVNWSSNKWKAGFAIFAGVVAVVVILVSLSSNNLIAGFDWWNVYYPHIIVALVVIGSIITIIATTKKSSSSGTPANP
jgi:hypothetical protein